MKHSLTCQRTGCKEEFFGRRNKLYCSPECKAEVNNSKAANKRKARNPIEKQLARNYDLLLLFRDKIKKLEIELETLIEMGFNPSLLPTDRPNYSGSYVDALTR
jgi:hypothetical protein